MAGIGLQPRRREHFTPDVYSATEATDIDQERDQESYFIKRLCAPCHCWLGKSSLTRDNQTAAGFLLRNGDTRIASAGLGCSVICPYP